MDLRGMGESFWSRIRQLPGKAAQLPQALGHVPEQVRAAMQDLPGTVQDGAKALLANEEVAEGFRTVARGVQEVAGKPVADAVSLSPGARPPAAPPVSTGAAAPVVVPPNPPRIAPVEAAIPPRSPAALVDALSKPSSGAAPAAPTLAPGPVRPAIATAAAPVAPTPAGRLPATVEPFPAVEQGLRQRASLLRDMGHSGPSATLEGFADRMNRAGQLYQDGQRASAYRMLHARVKPGLANGQVQEALRLSSRAEDLTSAFGLPRGGQSSFLEAAGSLRERAQMLRQTGHSGPARTLETFARRLDGAARQAAQGNRTEALALFRRSFGENVQGALRLSGKAEDALLAFGRRAADGSLAPAAFQGPFGQTAEKMLARAEWLRQTGKADQAATVTRFANRLVKAGEVAASGDRQAALSMFRRSLTPQVQEALRTSNRAGAVLEAFGPGSAGRAALPAAEAGVKVLDGGIRTASTGARAAEVVARGGSEVVEQAAVLADAAQRVEAGGSAVREAARVSSEVVESGAQVGRGAGVAARSAEAAVAGAGKATSNVGWLGRARQALGQAGERLKSLFGGLGKNGNPGGWQTIRQGFAQMLPGLGKAARSSAIFSAAFSAVENLVQVFRGERTTPRAIGGVLGDTASGVVGGVGSALASGAAIAGLGALGLAGLPLTLAAGAIGIGGFLLFDRFFKNSAIYDKLTHLFT